MKRFLVFPSALGVCGALFFVVFWAESIIAQYPIWRIAFKGPVFQEMMERILVSYSLAGLVVGVVTGIAFAFWDNLRNQQDQNKFAATRLPANLFWCLFYLTLITAINCALSNTLLWLYAKSFRYAAGTPYLYITWFIRIIALGAIILNLTAIPWAAIRSILTDDVLTPRVLRTKLRERSRLI